MRKTGILKTSIARKVAMSLSAFFLMIFLLQHFAINVTSIFSPDIFNDLSQFMGANWIIQFVMQPVLLFGVVFHFIMGFVLEAKNRASREVRYVKNNGAANSSWMSRNMLISGLVILAFLGLHFYDFWFPEIKTKFIDGDWTGMHDGVYRFWEELHHKFVSPVRVGIYCVAFVLLALHLLHGFNSAFQSLGANNKYTRGLTNFGFAYAILIPLGFIVIALYHHFTQL
jgi:succinate dehydrogenase / fumarate reductase cytochrome b subunit